MENPGLISTDQWLQMLSRRLQPTSRALLQERLQGHPWAWPDPDNFPALAEALSSHDINRASEPGVGDVLLLAYLPQSNQGSLWWLQREPDPAPRFERSAIQAWRDARSATSRSLPVAAASFRNIAGELRRACPIQRGTHLLDGRSLGLSFCIAIASTVLNRPASKDIAASAAITPDGLLEAVDGLEAKLRCLAEEARSVRRVLVADEQLEEAWRVAPCSIQPIGVRRVGEALNIAFSELGELLVELAGDAEARRETAERLFAIAHSGRSAAVCWTPIERAAELIAQAARDNGDEERVVDQARFARAVAARHEGDEEGVRAMPLPETQWFQLSYPPGIRRQIVSHIVQQSADSGFPERQVASALACSWLEGRRGLDAELDDLRIMGAWGRLLLTMGRPEDALERQQEALEGWLAYREFAECSYPLSAIYILAAGLEDERAWGDAREQEMKLRERASFRPDSLPYLTLTASRARLRLGIEREEALSDLEGLSADGNIPEHVRASALRWLARSNAHRTHAIEALAELQEANPRSRGDFRGLVELDDALRVSDSPTFARDISSVAASMYDNAPEAMEPARFVADFYPY